ncbi:uncharacterized protein DS421_7g203640 [Arachis hypogaea]|nr:uncharacterized protein DS421_7g203640 [Arachis hypogaea]
MSPPLSPGGEGSREERVLGERGRSRPVAAVGGRRPSRPATAVTTEPPCSLPSRPVSAAVDVRCRRRRSGHRKLPVERHPLGNLLKAIESYGHLFISYLL